MILKQAQSENYKLVIKSLPTMTKRIKNVIQFANHDKKSKMKNKYEEIFYSWRENLFPHQPKRIFKLLRFIIFPFSPENSISY